MTRTRVVDFSRCLADVLVLFLLLSAPVGAQEPTPQVDTGAEAAPAETGEPKQDRVTLAFNNANLPFVLGYIETKTGARIIPRGNIGETKISIGPAQDKTVEEALELLANSYGWKWIKRENNTYELMDQATFQQTVLPEYMIRKVFRPQHRPADEIAQLLETMKTPDLGSVAHDPSTGKIIVTDLPPRVNAMQQLIEEMDVPLYLRVFDIRYAPMEDVQAQIEPLLTPDVGTMNPDPRTHQIIVRDLFNVIKRMELLIMALDKAPEIRAYDINNVGIDGELFDTIVEKIEGVATVPENVQASFEQGRILVEDIPEVHDRIERILKAFDRPAKQIMLMAEIIEANLDRTFEWNAQFEFSPDLETAINQDLTGIFMDGTDSGGSGAGGAAAGDFAFSDLEDALPVVSIGSGGISVADIGENYAAQLSALLSDSDTKVLLKPRMIVLNQQTAVINVGRDEPIPTVFINDTLNQNFQQSSQTTISTGLEVEITPSITSSGLVEMQIYLENSEPFRVPVRNAQGVQQDLLGKTTQNLETQLIIPSGETRVLGGLNRKQNSETKSGVPILRSMPVVGPLFGSYRNISQDRSLLFFLTPIIIEEQPLPAFIARSRAQMPELATTRPTMSIPVTPTTRPLIEEEIGNRISFGEETGPFAEAEEEGAEVYLSSEPPSAFGEEEAEGAMGGAAMSGGVIGPKGKVTPSGAGATITTQPVKAIAPAATPIVTPLPTPVATPVTEVTPLPQPTPLSEPVQVMPTPVPTVTPPQ